MRQITIPVLLLLLFATAASSQSTSNFIPDEGISSPLHQANTGRITFMEKVVPIENYKAADFLDSFTLKEGTDLNIRVFLDQSLTNHLHPLAPQLSADALAQTGNYQFSFFVDDKLVYKENLSPGAGSAAYKHTKTILRVPLISSSNEDSWGRFLWNRFIMNGGDDAFSAGPHLLKIEMRPYVNNGGIKIGELLATGQLKVNVVKPAVDEKVIQVQHISAGSGWEPSTAAYDTALIKTLNRKIAENSFKNITSIVVIKDGKLLIEEYFNGASRNTLHDTRSVGKSLTSALMGIAIKDGYIKNEQQTLRAFYDLKKFAHYSAKKDSVSIHSLLSMSSAFDGSDDDSNSPGNEENMYPADNWVKFALGLPMRDTTIGAQWSYFTAGVVVLGDILHKTVPGGLEKYADQQLLLPLGIHTREWQYTPQQVANTAGGIRLRTLDLAKFGQLYKDQGKWKGKTIMPADWVNTSFSKHLKITGRENEYYGYLFWNKTYQARGRFFETWYCSGNGGNKVFICKDQPLVVVITATAYNKSYAHPQADRIMEQYILPAVIR